MRRRLIGAVSVGFLVAASALAEDRVGVTVLRMPLSVRQMGMGNVSLGGSDALRAWANPAALADLGSTGEVALNGSSMFSGQQTAGGAAAGWRVTPRWSVGALAAYHTLSAPNLDASGAESGAKLSQDTMAAGVGTAVRVGWLRVGVTAKMVSESLSGDSASAVAADAGAVAGLGGLAIGLAVRNVGTRIRKVDAVSPVAEALPTEIGGGLAYALPMVPVSVAAEYAMPQGRDASAGVGAEWRASRVFAVRAGAAGLGGPDEIQITAGLSVHYASMSVDYAFATHPLGAANRVSVSYGFGKSAAEIEADWAARPKPEPKPELKPAAQSPPPAAAEAPAPSKPAGLLNLAVSEFTAQGVSATDTAVIADILRSELVKTNAFNVVEKANMDKILAEQTFQQTGCTSEECAVKLGKLLNVQRMVVGSFGKLLDKYFVNLRVVNVETGRVVYGDTVNGRTVEEIQKGLNEVVARIAKSVR
ncbi:MAG: CsgG/HfaB family protein [Candidatus Coatesbacteria bacterium]